MKILLPCIALSLLVACGQKTQNKENQQSDSLEHGSVSAPIRVNALTAQNAQDLQLTIGTDGFVYTKYADSIVYEYDNYRVTCASNNGDTGERVVVRNNKNGKQFILETGDSYFQGLVGQYLILDMGTSTARGLEIYDLETQKVVFDANYWNDLSVSDKQLRYQTQVEITDSAQRPACDIDSTSGLTIGYLRECFYNFETRKLIETQNIECAGFE